MVNTYCSVCNDRLRHPLRLHRYVGRSAVDVCHRLSWWTWCPHCGAPRRGRLGPRLRRSGPVWGHPLRARPILCIARLCGDGHRVSHDSVIRSTGANRLGSLDCLFLRSIVAKYRCCEGRIRQTHQARAGCSRCHYVSAYAHWVLRFCSLPTCDANRVGVAPLRLGVCTTLHRDHRPAIERLSTSGK